MTFPSFLEMKYHKDVVSVSFCKFFTPQQCFISGNIRRFFKNAIGDLVTKWPNESALQILFRNSFLLCVLVGRAVLELIHIYVLCKFWLICTFCYQVSIWSLQMGFFERTPRLFLNKSLQKLHFWEYHPQIWVKTWSDIQLYLYGVFRPLASIWHPFFP